jgi:hypothetical protein
VIRKKRRPAASVNAAGLDSTGIVTKDKLVNASRLTASKFGQRLLEKLFGIFLCQSLVFLLVVFREGEKPFDRITRDESFEAMLEHGGCLLESFLAWCIESVYSL